MGGNDSFREPIEVDAEEFISVKSFKARGKRVTTNNVASVEELEPTRFPEPENEPEQPEGLPEEEGTEEVPDDFEGKSQQDIADEMYGQLHLFDEYKSFPFLKLLSCCHCIYGTGLYHFDKR